MRLAEVFGATVVPEDGAVLGHVHDVRLRDEPGEGFGNLVLDGLIVGPGAIQARLGYAYGGITGPAVLAWAMRRLGRRARYVEWDAVRSYDGATFVVHRETDTIHPHEHRWRER